MAGKKMKGKKYDADKPKIDLIPYEFIEGIARVLAFGAKKYEPYGWAKGLEYSRLIAACHRHLGAFSKGEDYDSETGLSHLLHAACCLCFLYVYTLYGLGRDDRWKRPKKKENEDLKSESKSSIQMQLASSSKIAAEMRILQQKQNTAKQGSEYPELGLTSLDKESL